VFRQQLPRTTKGLPYSSPWSSAAALSVPLPTLSAQGFAAGLDLASPSMFTNGTFPARVAILAEVPSLYAQQTDGWQYGAMHGALRTGLRLMPSTVDRRRSVRGFDQPLAGVRLLQGGR
jgi:hypothetical protein